MPQNQDQLRELVERRRAPGHPLEVERFESRAKLVAAVHYILGVPIMKFPSWYDLQLFVDHHYRQLRRLPRIIRDNLNSEYAFIQGFNTPAEFHANESWERDIYISAQPHATFDPRLYDPFQHYRDFQAQQLQAEVDEEIDEN